MALFRLYRDREELKLDRLHTPPNPSLSGHAYVCLKTLALDSDRPGFTWDLAFISSLSLDKLLYHSRPPFSHLLNGRENRQKADLSTDPKLS